MPCGKLASAVCPQGACIGGVVEWLMALVLKTSEVKASVGSNPTLSVFSTRRSDRQKAISRLIFRLGTVCGPGSNPPLCPVVAA